MRRLVAVLACLCFAILYLAAITLTSWGRGAHGAITLVFLATTIGAWNILNHPTKPVAAPTNTSDAS